MAVQHWEAEQRVLDDRSAEVAKALTGEGVDAGGIAVARGEHALWVGVAALIEPRRGAGHYQGGSAGVSVPVHVGGMRVRVGQNRGHYVAGPEVQTPVDRGRVVVTDRRVVFVGAKATREWAYTKLIAMTSTTDGSGVLLHVSNRDKVSGLVVDRPASLEYFVAVGQHVVENGVRATVDAAEAAAEAHRSQQPV